MKKYKLIKQEPFCCVPRCLQIIFDKNNIIFDSQTKIAKELGFRNNEKYQGTQVHKTEYSIEHYLTKHQIPLRFEYFFIIDYQSAREFLNKYCNEDIMVCYKRGAMFNKQMDGGHATLIEEINEDIITLIYPEDELGYRSVNLKSLLHAIEIHGEKNMAGFWLFEKIKKD